MLNKINRDMHGIRINTNGDKAGCYRELLPQIRSLIEGEPDATADLANVAAALKEAFGFFWVGFYLVKDGVGASGEKELILGPFQGPVACTRIGYGRGVCGTAWKSGKSIVVEDVEKFPGHIACSSLSRSEIVVPMICRGKNIVGVLDIDSDEVGTFDEVDRHFLEELCGIICSIIWECEK